MASLSQGVKDKPSLVQRLVLNLQELLQDHGSNLARLGGPYLSFVGSPFKVNADTREVSTIVKGDAVPHTVVFSWNDEPDPSEPLVDITCTCPISGGVECCRHTWAVGTVILRQLYNENSALSKMFTSLDPLAWRETLKPLDRYLHSMPPKSAGSGTTPSENPVIRRFAYRCEIERGFLSIFPVEQTILKNGGWGKGSRATWQRFYNEDPVDMGPVDQQIHQLVSRFAHEVPSYRNNYSGGKCAIPTNAELLKILTGHPLFFFEGETDSPLQILPGRIEIRVTLRKDGRFTLQPQINGREFSSFPIVSFETRSGIFCVDPAQNQLHYCEANAQDLAFIQTLYRQPISVPESGLPELLARLTELERSIKVIYPQELKGQTSLGDTRPRLRLIPRPGDGGLAIEIWSRPKTQGRYFEPGEGDHSIARFEDETRKAVERDFDAEREQALQCQQALRLDRFYSHRPWRWVLDGGDQTFDFLSELQEHKDAPWVVEWSNSDQPRPEILGEITPANLHLEIDSDRDWFGIEGTIDIGGEKVPLRAVLDALRKNSRYVQLKDGKWARIAEEFRDRLAALDDLLHRNQSKLNIDATAAPFLEDLLRDQQITIKAATEWRQALQRLEDSRHHNPQVPAELKADLRDYQVEGYRWLSRLAAWGVGGCLADDMGLGKTVQTLAVLLERKEVGPTLVIAPVSVGFNWVKETTRFAPTLRPHLYRDTERSEFLESVGPGDLVVASYGLLLRDAEAFGKVRWGTLVLDEAQFIKNSRTKSAQAVRDLNADWRIMLTGTPVENQLSDLWSLFRAASPGLFGSWERFRSRFADPIEKQKIPERSQALSRFVRPFILRRTKDEVLKELPPRTEMILTAQLSEAERKLYEDARLFALAQLSGIDTGKNETRFQVLAMLTRLRQLACHPRLVDEKWKESSAKLEVLLETIDEIRQGKHRALIFSQFTSHLEIIRQALDARNISYLYLDGQTPEKQRRERVEAFQRGTGDFFLISLKAGGTGLNLTGADYVIHMDPWWNPAVEDQATDRAHRIGQEKPVMVYRLVTQDTIEEKILNLHEKKRHLVADIMDGSDQAGKLSTEELIDLIKTSHAPEMPEAEQAKKPRGRPRKKP